MEPPDSPRLLDRVRDKIRLKHYSIRTEQAYVDWIRRFICFHGKRHPAELGAAEVEAFLTDLATARNVAASTQNQAKSALLFLYKEVLGVELPWLERIDSARAPARMPVVLTRQEVARVGRPSAGRASRCARAYRAAALRNRHARHGGDAPARQGRRLRAR